MVWRVRMKITKGTLIRTILLGMILLNMILRQTGHEVIAVDENSVASFVQMVIECGAIIAAWWKNNSFSENAKKADAYLQELNRQ